MFDTHEFVSTIKRAGATEEQAVLVLKAVSMAIDDMKANRVGKGASTDSMGTLTDQSATLLELKADINQQLGQLRYQLAGIKDLRFILELIFAAVVALIVPVVFIAIAAVSKHVL